MKENESYAVVTGASRGLGKCFASELAKRKRNLILVSLPQQNLQKTAHTLGKEFAIQTKCYEMDLSVKENLLNFTREINDQYDIDLLVNNAGIGGSQRFEDIHTDILDEMILLNVRATSLLTHELLPNLLRQKRGYVLNISSLAAYSPMGFKTVYPASKAFIDSFSRGLNRELKDSSVSISVINPGGMKTTAERARRIEKQGFLGKLTSREPEDVARQGIEGVLKGKSVIKVNLLSWLVLKITPTWLSLRILTRKMRNEAT